MLASTSYERQYMSLLAHAAKNTNVGGRSPKSPSAAKVQTKYEQIENKTVPKLRSPLECVARSGFGD